ncbi:MAG TPA: S8 family serine peptidase, partial [Verrucomicrobiae bacterium]|nr:S8 family serine peptidase [Verrucomicrobiae bacterium]
VALTACGGGGGGSSTPATAAPTPTASPAADAFTCPTSDTQLATTRGGASGIAGEARRGVRKGGATQSSSMLAVSYRTAAIANPASSIDARVASLGAAKVSEYAYPKLGLATRVLHVTPSTMSRVTSTLRATPGVVSVAPTRRLSALAVTKPYLGTDPYFDGQNGQSAPLYQNATTGGQWDMHIVQLEYALGYSQQGNGSSVLVNTNALGSNDVKLAIIDTGEDVTHPELKLASIVRTECFITNEAGTAQSTGTFVTDGFGHGTDVTGIAVANANNGYGFIGDGSNVSLMLYRVFPTPDDNCTNDTTTDAQCSAADTDIASAIDDAVAHGANVISMSLGGGECQSAGTDPDPVEGNAVANAIANSVIVVAASGNGGGSGVEAPACDAGVIAVGATGYWDGQPNGSNYTGGNTGGVNGATEYVTSYTQYGTTTSPGLITNWGIVAPGGDPSNADTTSSTTNYLHWIENIWTTTPYQSSSTDENFVGSCDGGEFNETGNCRTLIAGTSMATPHVAGAAALVLSVNGAYQSPLKMFQLLCSTADNIGDLHQGCGRLNVYRAVGTALGDTTF